jgi:RNA polymerase sigma factor (sigma-70 family)
MTSNSNEINALETMYAASQKRMRARLVGLGVPSNDVDDLRHEVFVVALRRRAALSNEAAAAVWLNQACEFVALAHRRKAHRRREIQKEVPEGDIAALLLTASEPDAADGSAERLHQALAALNPLERDLLALHLAADVPFRTLAELHGCDVKTVRKRFRAAAQRLRRILEAESAPLVSAGSPPVGLARHASESGDPGSAISLFRHWGTSAGVAVGSLGNVLITSWRGALTPHGLELIFDAGEHLRQHASSRIACLSVVQAGWPVPRFDGRQLIFKALEFLRQSCVGFSLYGADPNLRLAEQILRGLGFLLRTRYPLNASPDLHEAATWLVAQSTVRVNGFSPNAAQLVEAARRIEQA